MTKNTPMEDQDKQEFSWTSLFFVTGACFWVFSFILKFLDAAHVILFNRIGITATSLGIIAYLNTWFSHRTNENKQVEQEA